MGGITGIARLLQSEDATRNDLSRKKLALLPSSPLYLTNAFDYTFAHPHCHHA